MIFNTLALLAFATCTYAQGKTCQNPYPAPANATATHPVYFPPLGDGSTSAIYVGTDGTMSFTAMVCFCNPENFFIYTNSF